MREVTVNEALKEGKRTLLWMPIIIMVVCLIGGFAFGILFPDDRVLCIGLGVFLAFSLSWLWWSLKVVSWKIWAFTHVKDAKTLEKRAISRQLIWPRGNLLEKTEIKTYREKELLEELYQKVDASTPSREITVDDSLPEELTVGYSKVELYLYPIFSLGCFYLIYEENYLIGILGVLGFAYGAYDTTKKLRNKAFILKLNDTGVTLPSQTYRWEQIKTYYVEKKGFGKSTTYYLILEGPMMHESVPLADAPMSGFKIERYVDVYRSRYELKHTTRQP